MEKGWDDFRICVLFVIYSILEAIFRTARGWNKGTALSFAIPDERPYLEEIQKEINEQLGDNAIVPYEIRIKDLESFLLRTRVIVLVTTVDRVLFTEFNCICSQPRKCF